MEKRKMKIKRADELMPQQQGLFPSYACQARDEIIDTTVCIVEQARYPARCRGCNKFRKEK